MESEQQSTFTKVKNASGKKKKAANAFATTVTPNTEASHTQQDLEQSSAEQPPPNEDLPHFGEVSASAASADDKLSHSGKVPASAASDDKPSHFDEAPFPAETQSRKVSVRVSSALAYAEEEEKENEFVTLYRLLRQGGDIDGPNWLKELFSALEVKHSADLPREQWIPIITSIVSRAFQEDLPLCEETTRFIATLIENITTAMTDTNRYVKAEVGKGNDYVHRSQSFIKQFLDAVIAVYHISMIPTHLFNKRGISATTKVAISAPSKVAISAPSKVAISALSGQPAITQEMFTLMIARMIHKELLPVAQELFFEEKQEYAIHQWIHQNKKLPADHSKKVDLKHKLAPAHIGETMLAIAELVSPDVGKRVNEIVNTRLHKADIQADRIAVRIVARSAESQQQLTQAIKSTIKAARDNKALKGLASYAPMG
jgi:hypothetical protein